MSIDVHATWMRGLPSLHTDSVETNTRTVRAASVQVPGGLTFLGVQLAAGFTVDDRLILPLAGVSLGSAIGSYRPVHTSLDGSIARLHPWASTQFTALMPGLGFRGKERRLQWQVLARPGYTWLVMGGSVAAAGDSAEFRATRGLFTLRAEGELCRRLDPESRLCLFVGPTVYEHGWFNGGQGGLRWETGP